VFPLVVFPLVVFPLVVFPLGVFPALQLNCAYANWGSSKIVIATKNRTCHR
jgi:hypothetical protein